jgi:hypothetical protein
MTLRLFIGALLLVAGCAGPAVAPPEQALLSAELVNLPEGSQPKPEPGVCWAKDTTPAVIETVTEQVLVTPERRDANGNITTQASYQTKTHQRMVQDHAEVWFRTLCPEEFTTGFVASLQRALKARGLYLAPVTGSMDATTNEAIRRFQSELGLDSPTLSRTAAKELGLVAVGTSDK